MTNDFKNLHMNINDQDIVIRMQPSLDSNGNWTGDVHLSVIDSPANPLSDDDYNELMFFARMCLVGIDLVRSDIDFSKRVFKIVEDEIHEEQRKRQNALNAISDMFDNKGIVSLSQADKIINELKNQQIAAGTSKGTDLSFDPYSSAENFQKAKDLGILNEFGLTAAEQAKVDFSSRGFAEDPKDRPRDPNNPGGTMLTFPDPINDLSLKAPPGFVDIVMEEGKSPTFAGTDISIFGGRDPSAKLYSPLTEAEAQAQIDTGFSLEPIPYDFPLSLSPRDFTGSGVRAGVDLTPADFRVEQSDPEKVMRVPKSSLPASAQELASLRSGELDYGTSFPLQTILDARREKRFTQKELGDLLAGFKR